MNFPPEEAALRTVLEGSHSIAISGSCNETPQIRQKVPSHSEFVCKYAGSDATGSLKVRVCSPSANFPKDSCVNWTAG